MDCQTLPRGNVSLAASRTAVQLVASLSTLMDLLLVSISLSMGRELRKSGLLLPNIVAAESLTPAARGQAGECSSVAGWTQANIVPQVLSTQL